VQKDRRIDLDRAKGLGILLVVFGHLVAKNPPDGTAWYGFTQTAVYHFHMPFFLYLSGYVTFLSGAARIPPSGWLSLFIRRSERLLIPFFVFGMLFVLGKLLAARFLYVDHAPQSLGRAIVDLLWNTDDSPAISIWYMFVLLVYCIITPLLLKLLRANLWLLLLMALGLYFIGLPHRMFGDRVAGFYVFFVLGCLAAEAGQSWLDRVDRICIGALVALVAAAIAAAIWQDVFTSQWARLVCGALSMPALHGLVRRLPLARSQLLVTLGGYSFAIYLLNTPCIGLTKSILLKIMPWDGLNFLVFAPLLMLAGVAGPVLLKRHVLRRVPVLDRVTT
jgi:fucose 4-O-acetylase-like acetyltransferase